MSVPSKIIGKGFKIDLSNDYSRCIQMIKSRIGKLLRVSKYRREYIIKELGISKNTLSNWCTGYTYPTMDKAYKLAELLEVGIDELYEKED